MLNLLNPGVDTNWVDRIIVEPGDKMLFHKRGTFIHECELSESGCKFRFYDNIPHDWRGPFQLNVKWTFGDRIKSYSENEFIVDTNLLRFGFNKTRPQYRVRITLNSDLAYQNEYDMSQLLDSIF